MPVTNTVYVYNTKYFNMDGHESKSCSMFRVCFPSGLFLLRFHPVIEDNYILFIFLNFSINLVICVHCAMRHCINCPILNNMLSCWYAVLCTISVLACKHLFQCILFPIYSTSASSVQHCVKPIIWLFCDKFMENLGWSNKYFPFFPLRSRQISSKHWVRGRQNFSCKQGNLCCVCTLELQSWCDDHCALHTLCWVQGRHLCKRNSCISRSWTFLIPVWLGYMFIDSTEHRAKFLISIYLSTKPTKWIYPLLST